MNGTNNIYVPNPKVAPQNLSLLREGLQGETGIQGGTYKYSAAMVNKSVFIRF